MRARCSNPKHPSYKDYGGRGIHVHERWSSFEAFYADVGPRPGSGRAYNLDRINNDGDYAPGNCRWALGLVQHNNTRQNRHVTVNGVTMTWAQAARALGVPYHAVAKPLRAGKTIDHLAVHT